MAQEYGTTVTLSANGNSDGINVAPRGAQPGIASVVVSGDLGGGTLTFQKSHDNVNYVNMLLNDMSGSIQMSDTGGTALSLGGGCWLRFALAGATTPSVSISVNA